MTKNVIELNGKRYDALTGKMLGTKPVPTKPAVASKQTAQHLDGFSRRPAGTRSTPGHRAAHTPEKSKTLMRTVVKKPASPAKIHAKIPATSPVVAKREHTPSKALAEAVRPGRAIRATHTPKSTLISKFGGGAAIKTETLAVKPAPASSHTKTAKPVQKTPIITHAAQTIAKADPFQAALEQAISHEQPKTKKTRIHHHIARKLHVSPRVVNFAAITVLALGISGFIAYQNLPELAMRVAATRAGLNASLPSYQPSGFSMAGPIKYQPGEVTVNYKSNSDERAFDVIQKNSSWNSETLLENFVTTNKKPYQTFQANGRTIYIYEGNKATWVDGGIWYNIDGKSNLNSDQLLRIAGSL